MDDLVSEKGVDEWNKKEKDEGSLPKTNKKAKIKMNLPKTLKAIAHFAQEFMADDDSKDKYLELLLEMMRSKQRFFSCGICLGFGNHRKIGTCKAHDTSKYFTVGDFIDISKNKTRADQLK